MKKLGIIIASLAMVGCGEIRQQPESEKVMKYYEVTPLEQLQVNVSQLIGKGWMLITAGKLESYNTMTASWGTMGYLWGKNVATMYIRPQRYTKEFVDKEEIYTLSFFKEEYRAALQICGSKSGRDGDKVAEAGLTPVATPLGSVGFEQAYMIIECRKLYAEPFKVGAFVDTNIITSVYPAHDFHTMYVGEILNVYTK